MLITALVKLFQLQQEEQYLIKIQYIYSEVSQRYLFMSR